MAKQLSLPIPLWFSLNLTVKMREKNETESDKVRVQLVRPFQKPRFRME
jgi:hypothetical protein